jgi:hypothetical protein
MASAPKSKKRSPPHIGRPAFQPHEAGRWNEFDAYLWRRAVRVGINRVPYEYDWTRGGKHIYLPHFEFKKRTRTKRGERGAEAVKKLKFCFGRAFQRKTATKSYIEKATERGENNQKLRSIETGRELEESKRDADNEGYRSDELSTHPRLKELLAPPPIDSLDEGEDEWVDIDEEDDFDLVERDAEGMILETEDDWDVI